MTIPDIAAAIKSSAANKKPTLIAIEGFGGSGKTTLATQLAAALGGAYVIAIDDFIIKEKLAETGWDNGAFDRGRLEQQVLIPATTGQPIYYQQLEWATNTLSRPTEVPPVAYVIVEGISSYYPTIAHYYNYKIWVDTPMETAQQRGHARDGANENAAMWELWAANDLRYQQKHHPERRADFIINNA